MSTTNIIIIIVVILLLAVGAFVLFGGDGGDGVMDSAARSSETSSGNSGGSNFDAAPTFSLEDYDGNTVSSGDFEGKLLVLNSWATWCPFCVDELPDFGRLQQEFPDEIVVVAIDRAESLNRAKGFSDQLGVTDQMTFLLDPRDSFYRSIGGFAMPETLFVDTDGNIRVHKRGPMELEEMREKVLSILNS